MRPRGRDIEGQRVALDNLEPIGVARRELSERGHAASVLLDRDDTGRTLRQQRPGQPARPGSHLQDDSRRAGLCFPRDPAAKAGIKQEMLPERAPGLQVVARDDGGERGQRGVATGVCLTGGGRASQMRTSINADRCRSRTYRRASILQSAARDLLSDRFPIGTRGGRISQYRAPVDQRDDVVTVERPHGRRDGSRFHLRKRGLDLAGQLTFDDPANVPADGGGGALRKLTGDLGEVGAGCQLPVEARGGATNFSLLHA